MVDEIAPSAHDVYAVAEGKEDHWLATLRTLPMAVDYVTWLTPHFALAFPDVTLEVREL